MAQATDETQDQHQPGSKKGIQKIVLWSLTFVLVIAVGITTGVLLASDTSPVPGSIQKNVSTPVYYPDQSKLPNSFVLDTTSFSNPQKDTVLYDVYYDKQQMITFSLQPKPDSNKIKKFVDGFIPINKTLQTQLGQAQVGAHSTNGRTRVLASLPLTNHNVWIIVTAPESISDEQLRQLFNSLKK